MWLAGKHHLSPSDLEMIRGSGPKNRILKGDVLNYLLNSTSSGAIEFERYFTIDLDLKSSNKPNLFKLVQESMTLSKSLEISQPPYYLTRLQQNTTAMMKFDDKVTQKQFQNFQDSNLSPKSGSMRIIDALGLGKQHEFPTQHLENNESIILSVSYADDEYQDNILNSLIGQEVPKAKTMTEDSMDLFQFLGSDSNPTTTLVKVEMTIDSRSIPTTKATKFLSKLKESIC